MFSDWLNPNPEEILFGVIYFSISLSLFPLYAVVMMALYSKMIKESCLTFTLMIIIYTVQLAQVICHFITSPILIFPVLQLELRKVITIIGVTLNTFWIAELPATALPAVCRILVFSNLITSKTLPFGVKLIIITFTTWLSFVLIYGVITDNFIFSSPAWKYDTSVYLATTFEELELISCFTSLVINYISYALLASLIWLKKQASVSASLRKNEVAILIQYTFLTTYTGISIIAWHKGELWFDMGSPRIQATINAFWIWGNCLNPVLLLVLNRSIRNESLRILRIKPNQLGIGSNSYQMTQKRKSVMM